MTPAEIVHRALAAATVVDVQQLQQQLTAALGGRHERPLGDRWNNHGLMGQSGSFDLKLIEQLTNMQDAVLERLALHRFGGAPIPYITPHEAAQDLLHDVPAEQRDDLALVRFVESDGDPGRSKRLTAVFRDQGCGLTPELVPLTIFQLGGKLKEDRLWQQGAFGMGGATTYRNAEAAVLVARRDPALLGPGEPDRITVAAVEWKSMVKGRSAYYLVDRPWNRAGDDGAPWSCPASEVPDFQPGTHLALVSYGVDGIHRKREGDEKSFDTIANTRLFDPVMTVKFINETARGRTTRLNGLRRRLEAQPEDYIPSDDWLVPFGLGGCTYQLPISYHLFNKRGEAGERRKFVAHDHAVVFTSNGQVHHHWNPVHFRAKTRLKQLSDRILVVVETDALPINVRTGLFTADRASLVRTDAAVRLEEAVAEAVNTWDELIEENNQLIRDALRGGDQPSLDIARKISRLLEARGFSPGGGQGTSGGSGGRGNGGGGEPGKPRKLDLLPDPTYVTGATTRTMQIGKTSSMTLYVDAVDEFWERGRGRLEVQIDHTEIGPAEITVSKGRNGRVKLFIAVPDSAVPGTEELRVILADWHRAAGGLGPTLTHTCKIELVEELTGAGSGGGKSGGGTKGTSGASPGSLVALQWTTDEAKEGWTTTTVGEVTELPAVDLAAAMPEYAEVAALGARPIPVILLNADYPPLKSYLRGRTKNLIDLNRPKDQYAIGVGVELALTQQEVKRRSEKDEPIDEDWIKFAHQSAAQAILAVMPAADELARQAGLETD